MAQAYVFFENETAVIGNEYIERRFSTKNNKLSTVEIINKRVEGTKKLKLTSFSAEFFVGFRRKKMLGFTTDFMSSNDLEVQSVNVLKRRVEFVFKPYAYNGARITFIMSVEIDDNQHFMHKYIEMMVDPDRQHLVTIDYIDCEHICFENAEQQWTIGDIDKAYLSKYHSALGQPFYINGLFFGSEFPLCENKINNGTGYVRYFSGKSFNQLKLNCGHTYKTWSTVVGASRSLDFRVIREDFLNYIRQISRKVQPRFQYNSWYDHMHNITDENIKKSFYEIEKGLSSTLVPPLHSYVVDDGFVDWDADFWKFNKKFPNELYPATSIAKKFSSNFGLWNGPRGGYNDKTPVFGKNMEKAGKGGYNRSSADVCVSSLDYIKNITEYYLDYTKKFDLNYWKLDGFLLSACPSKKHGHITGGYNDMYQYTEMWENWIDIFKRIRLQREVAGKDMWINQTSYCNASPWFLQWSDSLWIQNSGDIGFIDKAKNGEKLSNADVDRVLTYRDDRYYDFSVTRNYQFPHEFIYNHDPIYGNTAEIKMTDDEFRKYMFMMSTRGTAFWELYYSYNMFNSAKWRINADALRFIRNEYETLKASQFIGGCPAKGEVYGYSCWSENVGVLSLRNPANKPQSISVVFDETNGVSKNAKDLRLAFVYPYNKPTDGRLYKYGDTVTLKLNPLEAVVMKLSNAQEPLPQLVYGRFNGEKEMLLFFNDRILVDENTISSDEQISNVELLEDYSTLKITFKENIEKAFVSLNVKNIFGDVAGAEISCKNYKNFVCDSVPCGRDFTVSCTVENADDGNLFSIGDIANVSRHNGLGAIRFYGKSSLGDVEIGNGDQITVVCEPNGLLKLYINKALACSAYNGGQYAKDLEGASVVATDKIKDVKIISKALAYNEI